MSNDASAMGPTKSLVSLPEMRFPDFSDGRGWQTLPLSKVLRPVSREVAKPTSQYTGLGLRSHGKGTFRKLHQDPDKIAMDHLYVVRAGDLIVNITFAWEGAIAVAAHDDEGCLVSHRFPTYEVKPNISTPDFLRYVIARKAFVYKLGVISPGGAGRNRVMNKKDFLRLSVSLPSLDEQKKISAILSSLDELIGAESEKLNALREQKRGLMQRLFPRPERIENGERVPAENKPRLRFPEFEGTGDWEADTIDNSTTSFSGGTPSTTDPSFYGGNTPFIRSAEIDSDATELTLTDHGLDNSSAKLINCGDVLIAMYGANSGNAAISRISGAINQAVLCLRHKDSNEFLFQFWCSRQQWVTEKYLQGGQGNLSANIIKSIPMPTPRESEQSKIAKVLCALDVLISQQRERLAALECHQSGLLQKLFPVAGGVQE